MLFFCFGILFDLLFQLAITLETNVSSLCVHGGFQSGTLSQPGSWANICPGKKVTCSGPVVSWQFLNLATSGRLIHLSIWRRRHNIPAERYRLVGYNSVNATARGFISYFVPGDKQIYAQKGDIFGIFYEKPSRRGAIPFSTGSSEDYDCLSFRLYRKGLENQMSGRGFAKIKAQVVRRNYHLQIVTGSSHCSVGFDIPSQLSIPPQSQSYAQFCFDMVFSCSGTLTRWEWYSSLDDGTVFYLAVFRRLYDDRYSLIGSTRIKAEKRGKQSTVLSNERQIFVMEGDFGAVYYNNPATQAVVLVRTITKPTHLHSSMYMGCVESPLYSATITTQFRARGYVRLQRREGNVKKHVYFKGHVTDRFENNSCGEPPTVANSRMYGIGRTVSALRVYVCNPGTVQFGDQTIYCQTDGVWRPKPPRCLLFSG